VLPTPEIKEEVEGEPVSPEEERPHPSGKAIPKIDSDKDGITDDVENELLEKFSPYLKFAGQTSPPLDAIWFIQNSSLKPKAVQDSRTIIETRILQENPSSLLTATDIGSSDLTINKRQSKYALNLSDGCRWGTGGYGRIYSSHHHEDIVNDLQTRGNIGMYGHVVPYGKYYKIEYYQVFGYSHAFKTLCIGDHEGDWSILQLVYDPETDRIVKVLHYSHGKEMSFDMRLGRRKGYLQNGEIKEFAGPNYNTGYIDIAQQDDYDDFDGRCDAQNNLVRFYQDPETKEYTHPVVYVEAGAHEYWPSEHWGYIYWLGGVDYRSPNHNGDDYSYLSKNIPNLGEVENPADENAKIIMRYNGRWGAWGRKNSPPPGPVLHWEWTWPPNTTLRPQVVNDAFEDGTSIGHHWPVVVETLATFSIYKWDGLTAGDIDGDGLDEIIHGEKKKDKIFIYDALGRKMKEIDVLNGFGGGDGLTAGDFDGDGKDEIIHGDYEDNKIKIWKNGSGWRWEFLVKDEDYEKDDGLATGDVDGDGRDEILHADRQTDMVTIYELEENTLKTDKFPLSNGFGQGDALASGDVDGDGKDEVIHGDYKDNKAKIYKLVEIKRMDGSKEEGYVIKWEFLAPDNDFEKFDRLACGDVNNDGKEEIIFADRNDKLYIFDKSGNKLPVGRNFQKATFYIDFKEGDCIAAGTFTEPGKYEVVFADSNDFLKVFSFPDWLWTQEEHPARLEEADHVAKPPAPKELEEEADHVAEPTGEYEGRRLGPGIKKEE